MKVQLSVVSLLATTLIVLLGVQPLAADDLLNDSRFVRQLVAPMTQVIVGKPFRETITQVAKQADLNVWIDRRVDPSAPISPGQLGPTVYAVLQQIAKERGCVVTPAANVVVIGRPDWVDATVASLIPIATSTKRMDLQWPDLTTPSEAFTITTGKSLRLPHDLWPQTELKQVHLAVAINLVYSQFDRQLRAPQSKDSFQSDVASSAKPVTRRYSKEAELQTVLREADPKVRIKTVGDNLAVTTNSLVHRAATDFLLGRAEPKAKVTLDTPQFSLDLDDAVVAGAALHQFSKTAGMQCTIKPDAMENCQKFITLSVKNKTLRELISLIAKKANVKLEWRPKEIIVTK